MINPMNLVTYGIETFKYITKKSIDRTKDFVIDAYDKEWSLPAIDSNWTKYVTGVINDSLKDIKYDSILEVGCGIGSNLRALMDSSKKLYGLDISRKCIEYAKSFKDNINYFCCSAENIPLKSVDVIYTVHALEQMSRFLDIVLKEIYRVACKRVVFIEPFYEDQNIFGKMYNKRNSYPRDMYNRIMDIGFNALSFRKLPVESSPVNKSSLLICSKK